MREAQKVKAGEIIAGCPAGEVSVAAVNTGIEEYRICSHCGAHGSQKVLALVMDKEALAVSDGNASYPPCTAVPGVNHEVINRSSVECVRGEFHIQNVNNRYSHFKDFIGCRKGIAAGYIAGYLHRFHFIVCEKGLISSFCLAGTIGAMSVNMIRE